jgi:hypothetical protein
MLWKKSCFKGYFLIVRPRVMDGFHEVKKEHKVLAKKGDFEWTGRAEWLS